VLKLMCAALIRAGQTWRRVVISEFELKQLEALREELEDEYKQRTMSTNNEPHQQSSPHPAHEFPAITRLDPQGGSFE
jgi:hypothetical protein